MSGAQRGFEDDNDGRRGHIARSNSGYLSRDGRTVARESPPWSPGASRDPRYQSADFDRRLGPRGELVDGRETSRYEYRDRRRDSLDDAEFRSHRRAFHLLSDGRGGSGGRTYEGRGMGQRDSELYSPRRRDDDDRRGYEGVSQRKRSGDALPRSPKRQRRSEEDNGDRGRRNEGSERLNPDDGGSRQARRAAEGFRGRDDTNEFRRFREHEKDEPASGRGSFSGSREHKQDYDSVARDGRPYRRGGYEDDPNRTSDGGRRDGRTVDREWRASEPGRGRGDTREISRCDELESRRAADNREGSCGGSSRREEPSRSSGSFSRFTTSRGGSQRDRDWPESDGEIDEGPRSARRNVRGGASGREDPPRSRSPGSFSRFTNSRGDSRQDRDWPQSDGEIDERPTCSRRSLDRSGASEEHEGQRPPPKASRFLNRLEPGRESSVKSLGSSRNRDGSRRASASCRRDDGVHPVDGEDFEKRRDTRAPRSSRSGPTREVLENPSPVHSRQVRDVIDSSSGCDKDAHRRASAGAASSREPSRQVSGHLGPNSKLAARGSEKVRGVENSDVSSGRQDTPLEVSSRESVTKEVNEPSSHQSRTNGSTRLEGVTEVSKPVTVVSKPSPTVSNGSKKKKNLKDPLQTDLYNCMVCGAMQMPHFNFQQHIVGRKHKAKFAQLKFASRNWALAELEKTTSVPKQQRMVLNKGVGSRAADSNVETGLDGAVRCKANNASEVREGSEVQSNFSAERKLADPDCAVEPPKDRTLPTGECDMYRGSTSQDGRSRVPSTSGGPKARHTQSSSLPASECALQSETKGGAYLGSRYDSRHETERQAALPTSGHAPQEAPRSFRDPVAEDPEKNRSEPMTAELWKAYERQNMHGDELDTLAFKIVRDALLSPTVGLDVDNVKALSDVLESVPCVNEGEEAKFFSSSFPESELFPFGQGEASEDQLDVLSRAACVLFSSINPRYRGPRASEAVDESWGVSNQTNEELNRLADQPGFGYMYGLSRGIDFHPENDQHYGPLPPGDLIIPVGIPALVSGLPGAVKDSKAVVADELFQKLQHRNFSKMYDKFLD